MTSDDPESHDGAATPTDADATAETETKIIIEFTVPADRFRLAETLRAHPDRIVEFEQLVPTHDQVMPYLWVTNGDDHVAFESTLRADSTVVSAQRVTVLGDSVLYHVDWADVEDGILRWIRDRDGTMLESEGHDGDWTFKLRVNSREASGDFQDYCSDNDVPFELIRLYELTDPKMGQYNVTEKQREILITALQMGFFEIPRESTLEDVADATGISKRAASERLRRGHENLVSNTLTIGQLTGVGLGSRSD